MDRLLLTRERPLAPERAAPAAQEREREREADLEGPVAASPSSELTPGLVLTLQRSSGNAAVSRLVRDRAEAKKKKRKGDDQPKGFIQMVMDWARRMLGIGQKEAQQALDEKDEAPGAANGTGGKGGPAGRSGKAKPAHGGKGGRVGGARVHGPVGGARAQNGAGPAPAAGTANVVPEGGRRPKKPDEDPAFRALKERIGAAAAGKKEHPPSESKAAEAQAAAKGPPNEVASQAKGAQVEDMAAQKPGAFDKKAFMAAVHKAVEAATPKNLKQVSDFKDSGKAGEVRDRVEGMVTQNKEAAEAGIKGATEAPPDPSRGEAKEVVPMEEERPGAPPGPVGASAGMPPAATAQETDLSKGPAEVDKEMKENDVTDEQLQESNEPDMQQAVDAKKDAEKHSADAPKAYRAEEAAILGKAREGADQESTSGLSGMHKSKVQALTQITGSKAHTKSADEAKRAKVASDVEAIYGKTKVDVTKILDGIEPKVTSAFDTGEQAARAAFESYVDARMSAYKEDRYSGWRGKLRWFRDKLLGMPDAVNRFYEEGKNRYITAMDGVISNVADIVGTDLNAAHARIAQGQAEVKKYVQGLPKDLKKLGNDAAKEMGRRFEQLEGEIDAKQDDLVSTIANKYVESSGALDKRIEEMKEANKGLVDKAIGFVKGAIETLKRLKDLLMNVLRKAISVIGDILRHPIRFIENFMSGVKDGLHLFTDKIGSYLEDALIGWLFGPSVLGGRSIEKPQSLDFKGVVSLVLQVLGLTKEALLDRLTKKVGAPAVDKLKKGVEWIGLVITEGPAGLWKLVQQKVGDLYDLVIGGIKDFVITKVIKAGITWLISLLNPAGALIKIVKAIVDVVTFIFERAEQIADFINAILDAVIDVAKGNLGGIAKKIADGLGKGLSLAIGFLASLLGLGGIGDTVRGIIDKVRAPIKNLVDGLIDGAIRLGKRLFGRPAAWIRGKYEAGKAKAKELIHKGKTAVQKGVAWMKGKLGIASFTAAGEHHEVSAEMVNGTPQVRVASANPKKPVVFLEDLKQSRIDPITDLAKKQDLMKLYRAAMDRADELAGDIARLARVPDMPPKGTPSKEIQALLAALAADLQNLMDAAGRGIATGTISDPIPIIWYKRRDHYPQSIRLNLPKKGLTEVAMDGKTTIRIPDKVARVSVGTFSVHNVGDKKGDFYERPVDVGDAPGAEEREIIEQEEYERQMRERAERRDKGLPGKRDDYHRIVNYTGDEMRIGVASKFMPEELMERSRKKPLMRTEEEADTQAARETKAANHFKRILRFFGYKWDSPPMDPDHVLDLGFGGLDDILAENFWPAPREVNQQQFTQVYKQVVLYWDDTANEVRRSTPGRLKGKYFEIVELQ